MESTAEKLDLILMQNTLRITIPLKIIFTKLD